MNPAELFEETKRIYRRTRFKNSEPGSCLYWAACTIAVLAQHGFRRPLLQAGSAHWPTFLGDLDGYDYKPGTVWQSGAPCDVHCWVALPVEKILIDFSLHQVKEDFLLCPKPTRLDLPDYLWWDKQRVPYKYEPNGEAIEMVTDVLIRSIRIIP